MSLNSVRPWRNIYRRKSRKIHVGNIAVGGDAPISVQTMTNTLTTDVKATLAQITAAADAGADIITIHPEATENLEASILKIKELNKKVGVSLNPESKIDLIIKFLDKIDLRVAVS